MGYQRRSIAETVMRQLSGHLSLRDDDAQVLDAMAVVNALNRMTLLGMPPASRSYNRRTSGNHLVG